MIFSPVVVSGALEGVDTLTKVRLIEEALKIEQNFLCCPDDKEKHLIVIGWPSEGGRRGGDK